MILKIMENHNRVDISIKEGEIFLLPKYIPHSPQRFKDTIGLVIEFKREEGVLDSFQWYCDRCDHLLHEVDIDLENIVTQLFPLFGSYWNDLTARTCAKCGSIQNP